ncbi:cytochrome b5-like heme/steroid binding domain-containing protein [Kalaharituber pfeilii]|nr:cytochrome b5-like heme/steroid binding domain-containing protein [Kalaharituber pfeilii]
MASTRQRKPISNDSKSTASPPPSELKNEKETGFSILDILRMFGGVVLLSTALSYFVTDGESLTWGLRPHWARWDVVKSYFKQPLLLTDAQLAKYDGTDPALPIYVALNGSVFDVSANRETYGPGGSYHVFAGVDAARGFVTGCFKEDRTWDLRGVEDMYFELDDELDLFEAGKWAELVEKFGGGDGNGGLEEGRRRELRRRADERREKAWQKVVDTISYWDGFFRTHEKYVWVGTVKHRDISEDPVRPVCENAKKKRPPKKKD